MKRKLSQCMVMGALAFGMTSTAMTEEEVVKSSPADKFTPVAYEITEGDKTALALLLLGNKEHVEGLVCLGSKEQPAIEDGCLSVKGTTEQYDGISTIQLRGSDINNQNILVTKLIVKLPNDADAKKDEAVVLTGNFEGLQTKLVGHPIKQPVTFIAHPDQMSFVYQNRIHTYPPTSKISVTSTGTGCMAADGASGPCGF